MTKRGFGPALLSVTAVSIVVVSTAAAVLYHTRLVGPVLVLLGFVPWIPLKVLGRSVRSTAADIIFGAIDTGILGIAALIGASFAGVLGAIVGAAVGDSVTDGLAGLFEGKMAEHMRRHGIDDARTPLSSSMGKMSGCLLGVGIVLTVAWTVFQLPI
jgi:small-conductance mechanosensitive channel